MDLVDTDVLIDVQRGHPPALTWFASLTGLPAIPGFVAMELIQDARNSQEVSEATKLTAPFQVSGRRKLIASGRCPTLRRIICHTVSGSLTP
jgi:predicted nucleic acid-binding protein